MKRNALTSLLRGAALGAVLGAALGGCAITSRATPLEIRHFSPEGTTPHLTAQQATSTPRPPEARLRLGHVTSNASLRDAIVHRKSAVELEPYETLRWTEDPEDYVRRSLSRALFDGGALEQVVSGPAPTLEVQVIAFEEARRSKGKIGRVQLEYQLRDEQIVIASGDVTAERDAMGDSIEQVVAAIGAAMEQATSEVATKVTASMRERLQRTP